MTHLTRSFKIKARDFSRAGEVSIKVQDILKTVGFEASCIRRVSICAYESEMNVVMHGGDGVLSLTVAPESIFLEVEDNGPGIKDIELALQEGYSTATPEYREMGFGAGMGLPNIKKNAHFFDIDSQNGKGARLKMGFKVDRDNA